MLEIKNLKIEIETIQGKMIFKHEFKKMVNIICSKENTTGKSSIIAGIYYALGFEEIIGGKGVKVLTPAFKSTIIHNGVVLEVLESKVFLEISNGKDNITIYRPGKITNRKDNLITVYYGSLNQMSTVKSEDMYVHYQNSAISEKGFHAFLEKFLDLELPLVTTNDESERKLYLQLIFSCMFLEQKRGWADILSGMPHFGIKEPKKRIIEFILNLDVIKNEKLKFELKSLQKKLTTEWKNVYIDFSEKLKPYNLKIKDLSREIEIVEDNFNLNIIYQNEENILVLEDYIIKITEEINLLNRPKKNDVENFEELNKELQITNETIHDFEAKISNIEKELKQEIVTLNNLKHSLTLIEKDINNNKDALKLKKLGSSENLKTFKEICPTCSQKIADSVLISENQNINMSIEENINHLNSQYQLFEFAIAQKENQINNSSEQIEELNTKVRKLRLLSKFIKNDIYSLENSYSEAIVYQKVELQKLVSELNQIKESIGDYTERFVELSINWKQYLYDYETLPINKFTENDENKIRTLRKFFVDNLSDFGYKSKLDLDSVYISKETYLPAIENFDLKFDSSASDHIRAIWAFTIALLQTSNELKGNHPGIIILDEPGQHSIIIDDVKSLFEELNNFNGVNQMIVGITMKESDTMDLIREEFKKGNNGIYIDTHAFKLLE
ncbi:hypothetical protein ACMGD3_19790 [Lysinibacillus sphaericus]|uniref:hypothetical protein n=1 Tax=Lysinibacillus sphaericus TaxID=1421 RepID=UPI003F7B062A